jgi:hypothetical protein
MNQSSENIRQKFKPTETDEKKKRRSFLLPPLSFSEIQQKSPPLNIQTESVSDVIISETKTKDASDDMKPSLFAQENLEDNSNDQTETTATVISVIKDFVIVTLTLTLAYVTIQVVLSYVIGSPDDIQQKGLIASDSSVILREGRYYFDIYDSFSQKCLQVMI